MFTESRDANHNEEQVVLLGLPTNIKPDVNDATVTKVGGSPSWYHTSTNNTPICTKCHASLVQLCQVYAPVENKHRTLYIFGCLDCPSDCESGWKVLRQDKPFETSTNATAFKSPNDPPLQNPDTHNPNNATQSSLWGASNDWDDDSDVDESDLESTTCDKSNLSDISNLEKLLRERELLGNNSINTNEPTPKLDNLVSQNVQLSQVNDTHASSKNINLDAINGSQQSRCCILKIEEEPYPTEQVCQNSSKEFHLLAKYNEEQRQLGEEVIDTNVSKSDLDEIAKGSTANGESYEAGKATDKRLLYFMDRLNRAPTQCLRYAYNGSPVWPGLAKSNIAIPRCESCGAERTFEMQIVPGILDIYYQLEPSTQASSEKPLELNGFDFLSLCVYSCR